MGVSTLRPTDDATTSSEAQPGSLDRSSGASSSDAAGEVAPGAPAPSVAQSVPPPTSGTTVPPGTPRAVARDVDQDVRVRPQALPEATRAVPAVVAQAGGYVASSSVRERGSTAGADFELVVPEPRLERTIARLGDLGELRRLDRESADLTEETVSTADRLRDLRAERSTVRNQLARTSSEARADRLRARLSSLGSRIAALEASQRVLRGQTDESRISLTLSSGTAGAAADAAADDEGWGVGEAWEDAGTVLDAGAGVLLLGLAVLLPPALLAALLTGGWRRGRRRARERALGEA